MLVIVALVRELELQKDEQAQRLLPLGRNEDEDSLESLWVMKARRGAGAGVAARNVPRTLANDVCDELPWKAACCCCDG